MANRPIIIKVERITPRIEYVFDFVFKDRGVDYKFILEDSDFDFSYLENDTASFLLYSEDLEINPQFIEERCVFAFDGKEDYLASIFYVLTRMEEYTVRFKDNHDRFAASQSILSTYGLLDKPICDFWAEQIFNVIGKTIPSQKMEFEPTFDIDNTYAYQHKHGLRRKLSVFRDRLRRNKQRLKERKEVDKGGKDPYDTFDLIRSISKKCKVRIFWLVESHGKYDRNLDIEHPAHQALIKELGASVDIGIHPSYKSFCSPEIIKKEKNKLEGTINSEIDSSRQHFLRFTLPESYRTLLNVGIKNDYTMGFADEIGFRSGTARSFQWFDLMEESITELTVHPFVYMDGTLNEYLKLTPEQAKDQITNLYDEVNKYGGTFRFIWHNETIGEYNHWKGWREVLDHTLSLHHE